MESTRFFYLKQVCLIEAAIMSNIAEYAVMVGISYSLALRLAESNYLYMLWCIRSPVVVA